MVKLYIDDWGLSTVRNERSTVRTAEVSLMTVCTVTIEMSTCNDQRGFVVRIKGCTVRIDGLHNEH
jgi:hypothetical protein